MSLLTIATCRDPHRYSQEPDDQLLQTALHEVGVTTDLVAWDDPTYDWSRPDLVLIRSTWDYSSSYEPFLSWVKRVAQQTTLCNSVALVHWNAHKSYLRDLERQGIPIIATQWLPTQSQASLSSLMLSNQWRQVVIKPAVGTSGRQARIIAGHTLKEGQEHLDALLQSGDVMVQPFVPSFYSVGERSLIFINGSFTHAMRKRFTLVEGLDQEGLMSVLAEPEELAFAERVLRRLPVQTLFARVDLVRDHRHHLLLNELEVIEPVLYLAHSQEALRQLADACLLRLQQAAAPQKTAPGQVQGAVIMSSSIPSATPSHRDETGKQETEALVAVNRP
jgi:glutathione synthase/RimK-type ligase-like ATP-grasp enzyme